MSLAIKNLEITDNVVNKMSITDSLMNIQSTVGDVIFSSTSGIDVNNSINLGVGEVRDAKDVNNTTSNILLTSSANTKIVTDGTIQVQSGAIGGVNMVEFTKNPKTTSLLMPAVLTDILSMNGFLKVYTYTPVMTSSNATGATVYSSPYGYYIKMGAIFYVTLRMSITARNITTGSIRISLPSTSSGGSAPHGLNIGSLLNMNTAALEYYVQIPASTNYCNILIRSSEIALATSPLEWSQITDTFTCTISGTYFSSTFADT